jgi:hypothetical protein
VYLNVFYTNVKNFGEIIEVKPWNSAWENTSSIYEDKEKEVGKNSQKYYNEWFEWIGEEPPIVEPLSDDLWDISDW